MHSYKTILLSLFFVNCFLVGYTKTHTVKMLDSTFSPSSLIVNAGDVVIWTNASQTIHTVTSGTNCSPDGKWDSGNLDAGKKFTYTFPTAGTFNYFCIPHCQVGMKGVIKVLPSGTSTNDPNNIPNPTTVSYSFPDHQEEGHRNGAHHKNGILKGGRKYTVQMENYKFEPATLNVNPGDTVIWINNSGMVHTSTSGSNCSSDGNWNSGNVESGKQYMFVFSKEGTFPYYCTPHCLSGMKGTIYVGQTGVNPRDEEKKEERERVSFQSTDVISNQSVTTLPRGYLEFRVYHRFDDMGGKIGSGHNLYGFDNMRDMRIGFAYGITNCLMIGVGRSKGDQFQEPYQKVKELYDGYVKFRLLTQKNEPNGKDPFSLSLFANTVISAMESQTNDVYSEAYFPHFSDRFSHGFQVLAAYNFRKHLSLQVMPTYIKRNWVNPWTVEKDEINLFSIGGAMRWNFTKHFSLLGEYFYVFSDYRGNHANVFSQPLSVGVEFYTGKHIFHLNLSNSTGIIPNTFIPYTVSKWSDGQFRFGFSITRLFGVHKKEDKKGH